jgi:uncharacterized protein (UPF0335 family)
MTVCEFCEHFERGECHLGLKLPKKMACGEFLPNIEQFCSEPKDFVNTNQIVEMARFFGFQKMELKKITLMATKEENARTERERILKAAAIATAL